MFVSLDLETTGFNPKKDKIIEFGAIKFDMDGNSETLQFLVHPGITLPQIITHITGITDKDLEGAPSIEEKIEEIKEFIGDLPIIGHNITFDTNFLEANNVPIKNPLYDTCQLTSILLPGLKSYSLEILTTELNLKHEEKHRALDDAIAAKELFEMLATEYSQLPKELTEKITALSEKTDWELKTFLNSISPTQEKPPEPLAPTKEIDTIDIAEILAQDIPALFEKFPPYEPLTKSLAEANAKNSIIAVPHQTFINTLPTLSENTIQIDAPHKYISPTRLKSFENQSHFEDHEFSALLKYLIWINKTKTGLLSEVTLFNEERTTIHKVNINKNITPLAEEPFFKKSFEETSSPIVCTHEYLMEMLPSNKNLYLIDFENFTKNLFYHSSIYLKLDILLNQLQEIPTEVPESIETKATILFGLIGILFDKTNDRNLYIARSYITDQNINSKEWTDIKDSVNSLIEESKNLGDILDDKTAGPLANWKQSLTDLHKIFFDSDLDNEMTYIEKDFSDNIVVRRSPLSLETHINKILDKFEIQKIISENLDLNDNAEFTKNLFGLNPLLQLHKSKTEKENLLVKVVDDIPPNEHSEGTVLNHLPKFLKGQTAIIVNSKAKLKHLTIEIQKRTSSDLKVVSQLTGSLGKIETQFSADPENSVILMTPNFWKNFKAADKINTLILHKLPFDPPSEPYIIALGQKYDNAFNDFQIPRATFSLYQILHHIAPSQQSPKEAIILDSRLVQKSYGKDIMENISSIATTETLNIASLSQNRE